MLAKRDYLVFGSIAQALLEQAYFEHWEEDWTVKHVEGMRADQNLIIHPKWGEFLK